MGVSAALALSLGHLSAQVKPGRNVNMVSGTEWPGGDPYLRQQNEPNIAVSTRNVLHLLGGANDYRTVDLPGLPDEKPTGDAWLGLFKSLDGGKTWSSTLIPGYPQDDSAIGAISPLKLNGYDAGADPVIRAGSNGLFYYAGIAFQRPAIVGNSAVRATAPSDGPPTPKTNARREKSPARGAKAKGTEARNDKGAGVATTAGSAVFVSTFLDLNNVEAGDPIEYIRTTLVDSDPGTRFLDKQWTAVDIPRPGATTCSFNILREDGTAIPQEFPGGRVYVAYSAFTGEGDTQKAQILFSASQDCGATWSRPKVISTPQDPDVNDDGIVNNNDVAIVRASFGRRCGLTDYNPAADINGDCLVNLLDVSAVSRNLGRTYSTERRVPQGAAIAIHPLTGEIYVTWREFKSATLPAAIQFVKSSNFGASFTAPATVAAFDPLKENPFDQGTSPFSFRTNALPTIAADAERVYVAWSSRGKSAYKRDPATDATDGDARIVMSTSSDGANWTVPYAVDNPATPGSQIMPALVFGKGRLTLLYYDLREDVSALFQKFISDQDILVPPQGTTPIPYRHTLDVRLAQATPGPAPTFTSIRLSEYASGVLPGETQTQRLQFNPPNLPIFKQGTGAFLGDYLGLDMAPSMIPTPDGRWAFDIAPSAEATGYAVWTDNRNVRAGPGGSFAGYTPPNSPSRGQSSRYDPTIALDPCEPLLTGTRNQDIYSARFDNGLFAAVLGNAKPLGAFERAFALFVENNTAQVRSYRLTIQPPQNGTASFLQFGVAGSGTPLTTLDVSVPRYSTVARTVFVESPDPNERVVVSVVEIVAPGGTQVTNGQTATVTINGDASNPAIENPAIENPASIATVEVFNPVVSPAIENPAIENPAIENPAIENPAIENVTEANPGIISPAIENPAIENPAIENPAIENPAIENAALAEGSIADTTWVLTNNGNTAAVYSVRLLLNQAVPPGFQTQLIIHKTYTTPAAAGCDLKVQEHNVVLLNVTNPSFVQPGGNPAIENPAIENPAIEYATVAVAPGDRVEVTLRVFDPDADDQVTFRPAAAVTPAAVAQAVNSDTAAAGGTTPSASIALAITTAQLVDYILGSGVYSQQLTANAGGGVWSVSGGTLPPGLTLNPAGLLSGTPTTAGSYIFTVRFTTEGAGTVDRQFTIRVGQQLAFVTPAALGDGLMGVPYEQALVAEGGIGALTFTVEPSSVLPEGLLLLPNGVISGTPSVLGFFDFTIRVSDSALPAHAALRTFTMVVGSAGPTDLNISFSAAVPEPVAAGNTLTYTIQVANAGGGGASNVIVIQSLPQSVTFLAADPRCARQGTLISCAFGNVLPGSTKTLEVQVRPDVGGVTLVTTASVSAALGDTNPANNSNSRSTAVTGGGVREVWAVDLGASIVRRFDASTFAEQMPLSLGGLRVITDVAFNPGGTIAYAAFDGEGGDDGVAVVDTETLSVLTTAPFSGTPNKVVVAPDGSRYYVSTEIGDVLSIDATTHAISTITAGAGAYGLAVTPDGKYVLVANRFADTVSVIATATNTVAETVSLPLGVFPVEIAITPTGKRAFVTAYFGGDVSPFDTLFEIDTSTWDVVATLAPTTPQGIAISPDGTRAYVANYDIDRVSVIDLATNIIVSEVHTDQNSGPDSPQGVTVSPDGDLAFVALVNNNQVYVFETSTNEFIRSLEASAPTAVRYLRRPVSP